MRDTEIDDVLVSTNAVVRWYNNTPVFIISIAGVSSMGAGAWAAFARKGKWLMKIKK